MSFRPYHWPCLEEAPHGEHDHFDGPDNYTYHCTGLREHPCRCSYLPWYAAHHPLARVMQAGVFLINPHCRHHGMPAAGWRRWGKYWIKDEFHVWDTRRRYVTDADLSDFRGQGRQAPTPSPERQSSVKQLTTGNPR